VAPQAPTAKRRARQGKPSPPPVGASHTTPSSSITVPGGCASHTRRLLSHQTLTRKPAPAGARRARCARECVKERARLRRARALAGRLARCAAPPGSRSAAVSARTPHAPASRRSQTRAAPTPSGVTSPTPVTTTLISASVGPCNTCAAHVDHPTCRALQPAQPLPRVTSGDRGGHAQLCRPIVGGCA
jgi:hypothetical protein